ncbi:MAG: hypothetical protein BA864_00435 [Desulfuromonadales bacterium C00003093]|nr:MAG: hypothetical protein BA864_00435 [Desulfuromonadales bacterium C00003093]
MIEHKPLFEAMKQAVSQTLENMAFVETMEHYDQSYELPAEDLVWTSMLIMDPVQGELHLAMSKALLVKLTAAIFALDVDEVTEDQLHDSLDELLNTIGGLFMSNLLTDNQTYRLGLPEFGKGELPAREPNSVIWKLMTTDEDPLQVIATGAPLVALKD